ncbi:hypothetical protein JCM3766R1_005676 [Sporobolomyces carnicolor]
MLSRRAITPLRSLTRAASSTSAVAKRTALYDFHKDARHGGKMVQFAGWDMPLVYEGSDKGRVAGGAVAEHHQVRNSSGLFDVSHMVQSTFEGPGALKFLEYLLPASLSTLPIPPVSVDANTSLRSTLSVLLNEEGGILDDCMITRWGQDAFYLVTNAGRADVDLPWIHSQIDKWNSSNEKVEFKVLHDSALIALQGPKSHTALQRLLPASQSLQKLLTFGTSLHLEVPSLSTSCPPLHVARGGYTGEDGFEISVPAQYAADFAGMLLEQDEVKLAGLAARDSLRLEAGLCLYGNDLDESVGVGEAALNWVVGKDRRTEGAFIGSARTLKELGKGGCSRKRIGLTIEKGAPAREGAKIFAPEDTTTPIGTVTSGIPSPSLKQNIAMGYVATGASLNKKGSEVLVEVRGKMRKAQVVGMPWIKPGYYRGE